MEVDTPVGSSPGGNEAIAMLAGGGQGGAGGCQSSHCSYCFLHKMGEEKSFSDWRPNNTGSLRWQIGHLSEVLTTGIIHKTQSFGRGGLVFTQHS